MGRLAGRRKRWFAKLVSCRERGQDGTVLAPRKRERDSVYPRSAEDQARYRRRPFGVLFGRLAYWINTICHGARTVY